jgi:hypothetical protein
MPEIFPHHMTEQRLVNRLHLPSHVARALMLQIPRTRDGFRREDLRRFIASYKAGGDRNFNPEQPATNGSTIPC